MLIVPPAAVFASAALKVRHGARRGQPWASVPPAQTQLPVVHPSGARRRAGPAPAASTSRVAAANGNSVNFDMNALPTRGNVKGDQTSSTVGSVMDKDYLILKRASASRLSGEC